jgi:4-amino-4-deoxy-L-arabinose transferase-like glycosyltransferase
VLEQNITEPVHSHDHPRRVFAIPRRVWEAGVMLLFGALFAASVVSFSRNASPTYDEVAFLPAGYSYLRWDDYRLSPDHPPLTKQLAALPLLWRINWPAQVDLQNGEVSTRPETDGESSLRRAWAMSFEDSNAYYPFYAFGHAFLYGIRPGALPPPEANPSPVTVPPDPESFYNQADDLVFWGRMPILLLGLGLAWLVFLWAREWFGLAGGILSLALFCFDPNFIAHSGLVTTDVGVSLFMFGAVYFLWRICRRLEVISVVLFLLFFGLAFVTKFSAVLLLPIFWLTVLGRMLSPEPLLIGSAGRMKLASPALKMALFAGLFGAALLTTYATIWASYSFRYSAAKNPETAAKAEAQILRAGNPASGASGGAVESRVSHRELGYFPIEAAVRSSAAMKKLLPASPLGQVSNDDILKIMDEVPLGLGGKLILFAQRHRLLPEAFIYGFAYDEMKSHARSSFLLGNYSNTGFHSYFFYAFLLKTPLPALLLIVTALVLSLLRCVQRRLAPVFLLVPAGLYFLVAVTSHLNLGIRHLLPIYPFLYVLAGGLVLELDRWRRTTRIVALLAMLGAIAVSSRIVFFPAHGLKWQVVAPHYLAYFNELAGGPANGFKELADSNLDWGQDLKNLKLWLVAHDIKDPIYLCYFGMADPRFYQIAHYNMPGGCLFEPQVGFDVLQPGGLIAISATDLQGVYLSPAEHDAWKRILEHSVLVDTVGYSIFIYKFLGFDSKG